MLLARVEDVGNCLEVTEDVSGVLAVVDQEDEHKLVETDEQIW